MNLSEFKEVEQSVIDRCRVLGGSYQLFTESKGIKRNQLTIFENELLIPTGFKYNSFIIFTEIHENMYFAIVPLENIVWGKGKGHKNRSFLFEIDMINSAEFFLDIFQEKEEVKDTVIEEVSSVSAIPTNRPEHYGGDKNPYEVRKIEEYYNLGFNLGNVLKYVLRGGKKKNVTLKEDLEKAITYLTFEIEKISNEKQ